MRCVDPFNLPAPAEPSISVIGENKYSGPIRKNQPRLFTIAMHLTQLIINKLATTKTPAWPDRHTYGRFYTLMYRDIYIYAEL